MTTIKELRKHLKKYPKNASIMIKAPSGVLYEPLTDTLHYSSEMIILDSQTAAKEVQEHYES